MRTCSGHDNAPGEQVHEALHHLSLVGAQLVQPGCQPACTERLLVRASVRACHACQALAGQDQGKHLSAILRLSPTAPSRLAVELQGQGSFSIVHVRWAQPGRSIHDPERPTQHGQAYIWSFVRRPALLSMRAGACWAHQKPVTWTPRNRRSPRPTVTVLPPRAPYTCAETPCLHRGSPRCRQHDWCAQGIIQGWAAV